MSQRLTLKQRLGVRFVRGVSAAVFGWLAFKKRHVVVNKCEHRYGSHKDERVDELQPADTNLKPKEAVVYMHGGGWIACGKQYYPADLQFMCDAGYRVFNVEYPRAPENPAPYLFTSILRVVAWIKRQHPEIERIHMMGDSAGANLAAMYGVVYANPELFPHLGAGFSSEELLPPASTVLLYGLLDRETLLKENPEDMNFMVKLFLQAYGGEIVLRAGEIPPKHAITPMDLEWRNHPPAFLGVGDIDFLFESSERYARELDDRNIPCTHKVYSKAPHGFFNFDHAERPTLRKDVLEFLAGVN